MVDFLNCCVLVALLLVPIIVGHRTSKSLDGDK
jgi:hypothetical protein